jgi:predicted DNA-binding helix-hairpin-helix protein
LTTDPKCTWALANPADFPVDVLSADYEKLVRVPGIGPLSAKRIVSERHRTLIRGLADLRRLGVITKRAAGFVSLRGRRLLETRWTQQLGIWQPEEEIGAYHRVYEVSPGTFR